MKNDFIRNKNSKIQPKKAVKKTFSFYALVFALLFMFIGSILGSIAFVRTSTSESSINIAYADTIDTEYTFIGSNIFVPVSTYANNNGRLGVPDSTYIFHASYIPRIMKRSVFLPYNNNLTLNNCPYLSFDTISLSLGETVRNLMDYAWINNDLNFLTSSDLNSFFNTYFVVSSVYNGDSSNTITDLSQVSDTTTIYNKFIFLLGNQSNNIASRLAYGYAETFVPYAFNCNIYKVRLYCTDTYDAASNQIIYTNHIDYYDSNDKIFQIQFHGVWDVSNSINYSGTTYGYKDRYYYFSSVSNESAIQDAVRVENERLTQYYEDRIYNLERLYESQKESIRESAYQSGYNAGLSTENTTFLSLFGALFDAPIQAISSLLNFDVLGFNLWNFFTAIITIGIVIFVVRLFL